MSISSYFFYLCLREIWRLIWLTRRVRREALFGLQILFESKGNDFWNVVKSNGMVFLTICQIVLIKYSWLMSELLTVKNSSVLVLMIVIFKMFQISNLTASFSFFSFFQSDDNCLGLLHLAVHVRDWFLKVFFQRNLALNKWFCSKQITFV